MNRRDKRVTKNLTLYVLHQTVQRISNKQTEFDLVLMLSLKNTEVLCLREHWVKADYLNLIQIGKLVSYFSRKKYDHGGSCIYVKKKGIRTKELKCFKGISAEKELEMSVTELVDYGYTNVCISRSPVWV
jgi:hypothetical protein